MAVSQSDTQWNKAVKNAAGKVVKKGYLSQKGKPEKRVTGRVNLVVDTGAKKAGQTQKYVTGNKPVAAKRVASSQRNGPTSNKNVVTSPTVTTPTGPTVNTKTGSKSAYQAGRGQVAQSASARAARSKAASAADSRRKATRQGMTSGTVASAKNAPSRGMSMIPNALNPFGLVNKSREEQRPKYGEAKPKTASSVKQGVTYLANGNARVWDSRQKKMIVVVPTDYRHPKAKKR